MTDSARATLDRMNDEARQLRRTAAAWIDEANSPHRSGNIGRDCRALGWTSPDQLIRAADLKEREAHATRLALGL